MKTKEELKILKEEYESVAGKLKELTEDELLQVTGGDIAQRIIILGCPYRKDMRNYDTCNYEYKDTCLECTMCKGFEL